MKVTGAGWIAVAGVAALTVVVVVLATLALERSRGESVARPNPVPSFTLGVTTPSSTPSPAQPSPATPTSRADERFLTAGSEVWWRSAAGDCGVVEPLIERSDDRGATWADVTPRYLGIGQVAGLNAFTSVDAEMVATVGPECEVQALRTYTRGEFWEPYPEVLAGSRYVNAADTSVVILGEESVAAPCTSPTGLRTSGAAAALICDGVAWVRAGTDWVPLAPTGVIALAFAGTDVLIAHPDDACEGITVSRIAGVEASVVQLVGCAVGADPAAPAALTPSGADLLIWTGNEIVEFESAI